MLIEYLGHSCFRLTSKNGKSILTDPYTKVGYELPKGISADVITVSHEHFDHNYTQAVSCEIIVDSSEKQEVQSFSISGIDTFHDTEKGRLRGKNIVFKIKIDDMLVCHFGDLGEKCNADLCNSIGQIDILLLPVGGTYTIDAKEGKKYVDALQPKLVIPMHYKPEDGALDIATAQEFLTFYDIYQTVNDGKIEINNSDLQTETKVIYMKRRR